MSDDQINWLDLEPFSRRNSKIGSPLVTINVRKLIAFSTGFMHFAKEQITDMTHVALYFSKANNAIIFRFGKKGDEIILTYTKIVKPVPGRGNAIITARKFFNYYDIDIEKYAGKYLAELVDIPNLGKLWSIYLDK